MSKGPAAFAKADLLKCTLDLIVLKTLDALGPLHGYGIARRIEQVSQDVLRLNEGTVYTSLLRLQQQGVDRLGVGTLREQPAGEVLLDHQARAEATREPDAGLGADCRRDYLPP